MLILTTEQMDTVKAYGANIPEKLALDPFQTLNIIFIIFIFKE